ncbi:lithium:proton antiporter [Aureococcus anophagefferens]|uniref:Lithium:proton antiporter n=1 Tax=Aureococcus anophagefferens TaxID=44056 RepID=A0ABR1GED5_AURAN
MDDDGEETPSARPSRLSRAATVLRLRARTNSIALLVKRTVRLAPQIDRHIDVDANLSQALLCGLGLLVAVFSPLSHGKLMLPRNGPGWALFVTWLGANVCGKVLGGVGLPPLAGQLLGGVALRNLRVFHASALTGHWKAAIRSFGLGVIMMRSGLELDVDAIRRAGAVSLRLTVMPGLSEALAVGVVASYVFAMPFMLSLSLGFILAAVSPAVVVVGMFDLHQRGFGTAKGIPSIVVAAASMDDIVAMLGFSVCIGLAGGHGTVVENATHGPISVVVGALYGVLGGGLVGLTSLWDRPWKRTVATLLTGLLPMFVAEKLHAHGGGAIGALTTGLVGALAWKRGGLLKSGIVARLSSGPDEHHAHVVEHDLATLWSVLAQPLLFGAIGSELNFRRMAPLTIAKALLVIGVGVGVRLPAAYAATGDSGLTFVERAFVPKATVQAALASVPAQIIDSDSRGDAILTTAVLSILLTAPVGSVFIQKLGPKWLSADGPGGRSSSKESAAAADAGKDDALLGDGVELVDSSDAAPRDDDHGGDGMEPMLRIDAALERIRAELSFLARRVDDDDGATAALLRAKDGLESIEAANRVAGELLTYKMPTTVRIDTAGNFFKLQRSENEQAQEEDDKSAGSRTMGRRRSSFKMTAVGGLVQRRPSAASGARSRADSGGSDGGDAQGRTRVIQRRFNVSDAGPGIANSNFGRSLSLDDGLRAHSGTTLEDLAGAAAVPGDVDAAGDAGDAGGDVEAGDAGDAGS